jgi:hypothetical protein
MVGQARRGPRSPSHARIASTANAQNAHHPFHVVGQDVQRHFGTYVLERFHLEVRRSHPRLYRAEGMLHSLAADGKILRRYWTTAWQACALKAKCTTAKERRISRWEHEAVLEAVQARLDRRSITGILLARIGQTL